MPMPAARRQRAQEAAAPHRARFGQRLVLSALHRLLRVDTPPRLAVLIFHRVLPTPDSFLASDPDVQAFAELMRLVRERFSPLSLAEGLHRLTHHPLPPRAVSVTFDDGYADNLEVALPVLQRLEIPATLFIASGYLDGRCMWNDQLCQAIRHCPGTSVDLTPYGAGIRPLGGPRERAMLVWDLLRVFKYQAPEQREQVAADLAARYAPDLTSPMLTRTQVRELYNKGVEIGGHTVTHPILARTADQAAYREIAENKEDLEGLLGTRLRFFAYPNGKPNLDFTATHAVMARTLGYQAALTTGHGVAVAGTDPMRLPRFTPWERTPTRFGIRLLLNMRSIA
jgi:peptidoglycan/xylan/chitin deacetylase (PgdA/CDA1 family)